MNLGHLVIPEDNIELSTHTHTHICMYAHNDGDMSKGHRCQMKELLSAKAT